MELEKLNSDVFFNRLRKKEYSRLDKLGHVYLDYTGGNIYPQCLIDKHYKFLKKMSMETLIQRIRLRCCRKNL